MTVEEASRAITTYDIRWGCDVLRPVYDATNGLDGRVSIEVDPRLAKDTAKTIAEARALWWMVDRPNLFIKIPATREGLPAITQAISEGISVNVTLIFSLERYGEVIDAYMAGLEQAKAAGHDLSQIRSVASFFVSRVDTEVDGRLDKLGTPRGQGAARQGGRRERAAGLRAVRAEVRRASAGRAWPPAGRRVQRPLWASTSTKDPAFPDTMYVVDLVVADTVNTMPEATLKATADHGELRGDTVHGTYDDGPEGLRRPGGARHRLRRRRAGPRGRGRREVRGVVERAARHDQRPNYGMATELARSSTTEAHDGRTGKPQAWRRDRVIAD